jgi:hypothetical protein
MRNYLRSDWLYFAKVSFKREKIISGVGKGIRQNIRNERQILKNISDCPLGTARRKKSRFSLQPHVITLRTADSLSWVKVIGCRLGIIHVWARHPQHTQNSSNSSTIAADSNNGLTNTRCCGYSCLRYWCWVMVQPETCRAVSISNKMCNVASYWIYIRIFITLWNHFVYGRCKWCFYVPAEETNPSDNKLTLTTK